MTIDKMTADKMTVDEMTVDEMTRDKMTRDEMARDEMTRDEMTLDEMAVDERDLDEMSRDKMAVDDLTLQPIINTFMAGLKNKTKSSQTICDLFSPASVANVPDYKKNLCDVDHAGGHLEKQRISSLQRFILVPVIATDFL